jgi:pimeloyl-ACP methyl ester carboxylesterase
MLRLMPTTTTPDGVRLHYEVHGEAGEPVLLIMGLGTDRHLWERQIPAFSARHRVITFDNRGVGDSDRPPGPYSTATLAADALRVLDAVGVARAHVVGLSMGGMIAQRLVLSAPERVGALVLAATYARPDASISAISGDAAATLGAKAVGGGPASPLAMIMSGAFDLASLDMRSLFRFLVSLVFSDEFIAREKEWLRQIWQRAAARELPVHGFLGQVAAVLTHDTTEELRHVTRPTLVLTGDKDRLVPPHHSDELARLIPGARLTKIHGGHHGFNVEQADEFNRAVLDFLAEHPLSSA